MHARDHVRISKKSLQEKKKCLGKWIKVLRRNFRKYDPEKRRRGFDKRF